MAERYVILKVIYGEGGAAGGGTGPSVWPPVGGVNIEDYSGSGDGTTDNYSPLMAAISAAAGAPVYLPRGTYYFSPSTVTIPDGTTIVGESIYSTSLLTRIRFGSSSSFSYFTCGVSGNSAVVNSSGAFHTVFKNVCFSGGGSSSSTDGEPVVYISGNCSFTMFEYCDIQCNSGTVDSGMTKKYNNVTINVTDSDISNIYFSNCNIGTTNGTRTGSPRNGIEIYSNSASYRWKNIFISGSKIYTSDLHGIALYDNYQKPCFSTVIENCKLYGGGAAGKLNGSTINMELSMFPIVRKNYIYRGWDKAIRMSTNGYPYDGPYGEIRYNTFDTTFDNGITPLYGYTESHQLSLVGSNTYSNNTWITP